MAMASVCSIEVHSPLDIIEQVVTANDWLFDRPNDLEMAIHVPGKWCDFNFLCAWNEFGDSMHFTLMLDARVPGTRRSSINELLALINDKVWLGHFSVWAEEGNVAYRHALPLRGCAGPTREQIEDVLENAIQDCERFYPAFQYVIWGGRSPTDALAAAMIETLGEA